MRACGVSRDGLDLWVGTMSRLAFIRAGGRVRGRETDARRHTRAAGRTAVSPTVGTCCCWRARNRECVRQRRFRATRLNCFDQRRRVCGRDRAGCSAFRHARRSQGIHRFAVCGAIRAQTPKRLKPRLREIADARVALPPSAGGPPESVKV